MSQSLDDVLRDPHPTDPTAARYKDWLHVNFFHHSTGAIGLINASLHGDPRNPASLAVGTALVCRPDVGWVGSVQVVPREHAAVSRSRIALREIDMDLDPRTGRITASVRGPELTADVVGVPTLPSFTVPHPLPFGSGWISWAVTPRMRLVGSVEIGGQRLDLAAASGYQDHNWGRWLWGDDAGWAWAALHSQEPGPVLLLSRTTNRAHRTGSWRLHVIDAQARRTYGSPTIRIWTEGRWTASMARLPGAVAAMQSGRRRPALPARLFVALRDGADRFEVEFQVDGAVQVVLPEPVRPGYSYLHEMSGRFTGSGRWRGDDVEWFGLGVMELLD